MPTNRYYFDHAAATPVDPVVLEAMVPYMTEDFFNPSSPYAPAVRVRREYEAAKSRLAMTFGAKGDEIIITAGATESINLAFSAGSGHVVTTEIEHDAVLAAARRRDHSLVKPTSKGVITPEAVTAAITACTDLVSVQLANNEIGTIAPLREIAQVVAKERQRRQAADDSRPIVFHCDASQGFGQIDVNVARLGVDMLTLNAGKMYGPKQVGLLWVKPGIAVTPSIVGGGQERGLRSGTENVAGVIGFAVAAERAHSKRKSEAERIATLRDFLEQTLKGAIPDLVVNGHSKKRLPGSLHVSVPGLDGERLVFALEARQVFVATGSACAANKGTRSHVLTAIGASDDIADGSLRLTLGKLNDRASVEQAAAIVVEEVLREKRRIEHA